MMAGTTLLPCSLRDAARALAHIAFAAFLVLALATPDWRAGPFTWWPVLRFSMLAGRPADLGVLSLLPGLILVGWLTGRVFERPHRRWRWGSPSITLPLFGLTLLVLASLEPTVTWRTTVQVIGFCLAWLVYLFILNEAPDLRLPLALVLLIQGSVAMGQFLVQGDLGLGALGEMALDPTVDGVSVLSTNGQPWLRAYGLAPHPNVLGAALALLILLLLPALDATRGWRRVGITVALAAGLLGLLVSFSRAAWFAFAAGITVWQHTRRTGTERPASPSRLVPHASRLMPYTLLILGSIFVVRYHDLILSRFLHLETAIEARSLSERLRDAQVALALVVSHPWRGVGAGNVPVAAVLLHPSAGTVHNVPLLVAAESGLAGVGLWLWLAASGLRASSPALAPWLAMLVIGLFDNTLWLTTSWRAAIIVAMLAACVSAARWRGAE